MTLITMINDLIQHEKLIDAENEDDRTSTLKTEIDNFLLLFEELYEFKPIRKDLTLIAKFIKLTNHCEKIKEALLLQ